METLLLRNGLYSTVSEPLSSVRSESSTASLSDNAPYQELLELAHDWEESNGGYSNYYQESAPRRGGKYMHYNNQHTAESVGLCLQTGGKLSNFRNHLAAESNENGLQGGGKLNNFRNHLAIESNESPPIQNGGQYSNFRNQFSAESNVLNAQGNGNNINFRNQYAADSIDLHESVGNVDDLDLYLGPGLENEILELETETVSENISQFDLVNFQENCLMPAYNIAGVCDNSIMANVDTESARDNNIMPDYSITGICDNSIMPNVHIENICDNRIMPDPVDVEEPLPRLPILDEVGLGNPNTNYNSIDETEETTISEVQEILMDHKDTIDDILSLRADNEASMYTTEVSVNGPDQQNNYENRELLFNQETNVRRKVDKQLDSSDVNNRIKKTTPLRIPDNLVEDAINMDPSKFDIVLFLGDEEQGQPLRDNNINSNDKQPEPLTESRDSQKEEVKTENIASSSAIYEKIHITSRPKVIGRKRIDMKAQRYIFDDDEENIDVETITKEDNPVLEARDVDSLLVQFEASQIKESKKGKHSSSKLKKSKTKLDEKHGKKLKNIVKKKSILDALEEQIDKDASKKVEKSIERKSSKHKHKSSSDRVEDKKITINQEKTKNSTKQKETKITVDNQDRKSKEKRTSSKSSSTHSESKKSESSSKEKRKSDPSASAKDNSRSERKSKPDEKHKAESKNKDQPKTSSVKTSSKEKISSEIPKDLIGRIKEATKPRQIKLLDHLPFLIDPVMDKKKNTQKSKNTISKSDSYKIPTIKSAPLESSNRTTTSSSQISNPLKSGSSTSLLGSRPSTSLVSSRSSSVSSRPSTSSVPSRPTCSITSRPTSTWVPSRPTTTSVPSRSTSSQSSRPITSSVSSRPTSSVSSRPKSSVSSRPSTSSVPSTISAGSSLLRSNHISSIGSTADTRYVSRPSTSSAEPKPFTQFNPFSNIPSTSKTNLYSSESVFVSGTVQNKTPVPGNALIGNNCVFPRPTSSKSLLISRPHNAVPAVKTNPRDSATSTCTSDDSMDNKKGTYWHAVKLDHSYYKSALRTNTTESNDTPITKYKSPNSPHLNDNKCTSQITADQMEFEKILLLATKRDNEILMLKKKIGQQEQTVENIEKAKMPKKKIINVEDYLKENRDKMKLTEGSSKQQKHNSWFKDMELEASSSQNCSKEPKRPKPPAEIPTPPSIPGMIYKETYEVSINACLVDESALQNFQRVEELKPILQKNNVKIGKNSFLSSFIEDLPNKTKNENERQEDEVVRSNKVVGYVPEVMNKPAVCSVEVQTNISLISKEKPKRSISISSSDSSSGDDSYTSSDSHYSSRSRRRRSRSRGYRPRSSCSPIHLQNPNIPLPERFKSKDEHEEFKRDAELRRILFLGGIRPHIDTKFLHETFGRYGNIKAIKIYEKGRNKRMRMAEPVEPESYAFITFTDEGAVAALNYYDQDYPNGEKFVMCFGGRREFCRSAYADLDNEYRPPAQQHIQRPVRSFDNMLEDYINMKKNRHST